MSLWPRMALSAVVLALVMSVGNALLLHFEIGFVDRVRATEALVMIGHARKEIVLERAQRPAVRPTGPEGPVVLSMLGEPVSKRGLVIRYARDGDRLVARFSKAHPPGEQGVWILSPEAGSGDSEWVTTWRCTSQSTGAWKHIARNTCPDDGTAR